ncbi:MAG: hypothetical protein ACI7YS_11215 [Flavobacterium sp.]
MKVIQSVVERAKSPTPKFFKVLRTVGLVLAGISGSLIAAPVTLPATVVAVAGYLAVAGGVISAVSQVTVFAEPAPDGRGPQPKTGQNKDDPGVETE